MKILLDITESFQVLLWVTQVTNVAAVQTRVELYSCTVYQLVNRVIEWYNCVQMLKPQSTPRETCPIEVA
jgi:hypothetical protein